MFEQLLTCKPEELLRYTEEAFPQLENENAQKPPKVGGFCASNIQKSMVEISVIESLPLLNAKLFSYF